MVTTEMEKAGVRVFSGRVEDWFDYQDEVLAFFASRDLKEVLKTARPAEGQEAQRTEWDKQKECQDLLCASVVHERLGPNCGQSIWKGAVRRRWLA